MAKRNIWPFGKRTTYRVTRKPGPGLVGTATTYKGYKVWQSGDVWKTNADPESEFDSQRDVKAFISWLQKNPGALAEARRSMSRRQNAPVSSVRGRGWIQEWYETGDPQIKERSRALRQRGYRVSVESMGSQVTQWGRVRLSLLDIRPGMSGDDSLEAAANPGAAGSAFRRCVADVTAKGSAYDPRAVCATAGRKKYGKKAFQKMAAAGKRRASKRKGNPAELTESQAVALLVNRYGLKKAEAQRALASWGDGAGRPRRFSLKGIEGIGRRNPADEAAAVYEEFHGRPSEEIVTVTQKLHYHKHLAALGELRKIVVRAPDGGKVTLSQFGSAILCTNEQKNQMSIEGGDQAIDLEEFGIFEPHEVETLGEVLELAYFTTKDHLGKEGGTAVYFHETGETNERGRRKKVGWPPDLIYRVRDKRLEFSGGSYLIRGEGIDK